MGFTSERYFSNGKPVLRESVVLFLDILGSKDMATGPDPQAALELLFSAMSDADESQLMKANAEFPYYSWTAFTDNIVVGWPVRDDAELELGAVLANVAHFQFLLAKHGFFARGGVTVGQVFVADGFAFGPALVEAYELETMATFPRVVFANTTIKLLEKYRTYGSSPFDEDICVGEDGALFIDFLKSVYDLDGISPDEFNALKQRVERGLTVHGNNERVLLKYKWLADYLNFAASEWPMLPNPVKTEAETQKFLRLGLVWP